MEKLPEKFKKLLQNYISSILGVLVVIFFIWYLFQNQEILVHLKNISWKHILWIILLEMASFLINSLLDWLMINRLNGRVSFWDCYLLGYANNFLNKILPTIGGGAAFRAAFLKKKYNFPLTRFVSSIGGLYVISFFSTSLVGLFCLGWIYLNSRAFSSLIALAFLGIISFCLFIILFSPHISKNDNSITRVLNSIFIGWQVIKSEPRYVFIYAFLSMTFLLLSTLQIIASYQALSIETSFVPMLLLSTLGIIQAFLNFTPDGIGVREGIFIFTSNLVQVPGDVLVLGSLVLRGISFFTTFILGGISYVFLTNKLKGMFNAKSHSD
jgi:uncharacterized protein (TIRG00374 family)